MRRGDDSTNAGRPDKRGDGLGGGPGSPEVAYIFSRTAIRELDRLAVEEFGLPSIVLMENAAIGLAGAVSDFLESSPGGAVLIVAGRGNNGGDGLAAARHLHNEGRHVAVVLASPPESFTGDAATNLRVVTEMKIPVHVATEDNPRRAIEAAIASLADGIDAAAPHEEAGDAGGAAGVGGAGDERPRGGTWGLESGVPDIVVDALLGTGLTGRVGGLHAALIAEINELRGDGSVVVAADLPSGLDADSGSPMGEGEHPAVRADLTVSFVGLKEGFLILGAQEFLGEVVVSPIGAPAALTRRLGRAMPASEHPEDRPGEGARGSRRRGRGWGGRGAHGGGDEGEGRERPPPPAPRTH